MEVLMKKILWLVVFFFFFAGFLQASEKVFYFDSPEELGAFYPAQTAKCGTLSEWLLIDAPDAPSGKKALLVRPNPHTNHGSCFNVFITRQVRAKDLRLEVWVKAFKGREDQGGGPIWRVQDEDNYYVVRWNPLEDNFRLYYVKNGHRRMLASARVKAPAHKWHRITVEHRGDLIKCYFDGRLLLEKRDRTFVRSGGVGLWSKADAQTGFDLLKIQILSP